MMLFSATAPAHHLCRSWEFLFSAVMSADDQIAQGYYYLYVCHDRAHLADDCGWLVCDHHYVKLAKHLPYSGCPDITLVRKLESNNTPCLSSCFIPRVHFCIKFYLTWTWCCQPVNQESSWTIKLYKYKYTFSLVLFQGIVIGDASSHLWTLVNWCSDLMTAITWHRQRSPFYCWRESRD